MKTKSIRVISEIVAHVLSSPFELVPQNVEIVAVRRLDEVEGRLAFADQDGVVAQHRKSGLAVEGQYNALVL